MILKNNKNIIIKGAKENNLKNISLSIPKKKITVFTGVSGSGKSSLVFDTIAAESQRQLNETFDSFIRHRLPHYGQPNVDSIENLSVAIIIDQKRIGGNARSTVGTVTDIYTLLRLLFSRAGSPFVGYSDVFSFNNSKGMCPTCEGLGTINTIDIDKLTDRNKSLREGAILLPTFKPESWRWTRYTYSGYFDIDKKLKDYTEQEWEMLLYAKEHTPEHSLKEWPKTAKYEGIIPRIERSFLKRESREKNKHKEAFESVITQQKCPECNGMRLNKTVLQCKIQSKNIAECTAMQIDELISFIESIRISSVKSVLEALLKSLKHLTEIGLNYLSLNRETTTLSGGESQRIKMIKHLGSSLTDLIYIFDEPSIGLHPGDIDKLNQLILQLRDKNNTILIVEHDPDVIAIAEHIIDMGPNAGKNGGKIIYQGDLYGLKQSNGLTGKYLSIKPTLKTSFRTAKGFLEIKNACLNNLKNVTVSIPKGVLSVITGIAGSGKSTLIHQVLTQKYPDIQLIDQSVLRGSKRSNLATYTGISDTIRNLFAQTNRVSASLFSTNSTGACAECKGLGILSTDLAFMDTVEETCEVCDGTGYRKEVLQYTLRDKNISEILQFTVTEAYDFFSEPEIHTVLKQLIKTGLEYMTLGQSLNTFSGGERQRVKLAAKLESKKDIFVFDEPTTGLHLSDISKLMTLFNLMIDKGNTIIIIEHHLDIISQADWIIDMGPGAGNNGGEILFEGTPAEIINYKASATGYYLKKHIC